MNQNNNQFSYFQIIKLHRDFAIFLDKTAFEDEGIGEVVTAEEIAQILGN